MERRCQALGPPRDTKALPRACALPQNRKEAIIRPDERLAACADHDRIALAAYAGIDDREERAAARIFGRERGKQVRSRLDAEIRRIVQSIYNRDPGRERGEECLDLTDVEVARPEVGEENDQAALAAFFSSVFFSAFFSGFFLSPGSCGAAASSDRSISVTSAIGALSPLRKPIFRMRR